MKKYLGTLGSWDFFIASTNGQHSDQESVREIQRNRYKLITTERSPHGGQEIDLFCTGINLDHESLREISAFDDFDSTFHIFAIGNKTSKKAVGRLGCSCSFALESQEKIGGGMVGLPHENRVPGVYPAGFDLDPLRGSYKYKGQFTKPSQRGELFRHFKSVEFVGDKAASFGVYRGAYREFIFEKKRKGLEPVTKWFFCSKPTYYQHLYRPFGAMLAPLLINQHSPDKASPPLKALRKCSDNGSFQSGGFWYNRTLVSYRYPMIFARNPGGEKTTRWFDYFSEFVDWDRSQDMVKTPLSFWRRPHLNRIAWGLIAEHLFMVKGNFIHDRAINYAAKLLTKSSPSFGWDF